MSGGAVLDQLAGVVCVGSGLHLQWSMVQARRTAWQAARLRRELAWQAGDLETAFTVVELPPRTLWGLAAGHVTGGVFVAYGLALVLL